MQYKVATHACVEHENHIYVIGWDGGEKLDLVTMTWENLPALPFLPFHLWPSILLQLLPVPDQHGGEGGSDGEAQQGQSVGDN